MAKMELPDPEKWEKMISLYEELAHPFTTYFAKEAVNALSIGPNDKVLDIATGIGSVAFAAADCGADVVAIDYTPGMINRVKAEGRENIQAMVMNGEDLSFADGSFDAVLSVFGVMLFENWQQGLAEMGRVTRRDGRAAIAIWKDPRGAGPNLLLLKLIETHLPDFDMPEPPGGMARLSNPLHLTEEMEKGGFSGVHIEEISHAFELRLDRLRKAEELFEMAPFWNSLSAPQKEVILKAFNDVAAREGKDGILAIPSTALLAVARKA